MYTRWLRIGNYQRDFSYAEWLKTGERKFWEFSLDETWTPATEMHFNNDLEYISDSYLAVFTTIKIDSQITYCQRVEPFKFNIETRLRITFSPAFEQELLNGFKKLGIEFLPSDGNVPDPHCLQFNDLVAHAEVILDMENLHKLLKLFKYFNERVDPKPFPVELINDLQQIALLQEESDLLRFKHQVGQVDIAPRETVYFSRKSTASIFRKEDFSEKHCQLLLEGFDPNARGDFGDWTLLHYVIAYQDEPQRALELLLWYGGNSFIRRVDGFGNNYFSSFELTVALKKYDLTNIIINHHSKISPKRVTDSKPIKAVRVAALEYQVFTFFEFLSGEKIITRLIPVSSLDETEKLQLFTIFKATFSITTTAAGLEKEFNKEFSANRLIDLIYHNNVIIGFNLLEIVKPDSNQFPKHLFVYGAYAAIKPEFRDLGLMQILCFRLAYALKQLNPDNVVGYFYSAIHYNSYRLAKFMHWPKYQDAYMTLLAENLLHAIMPDNYHYVHKGLVTYVEESVSVLPSGKASEPTLGERIFNRELLGNPEGTSTEKVRSVPVVFIVNDENLEFMHNHASGLGFKFRDHINTFARCVGNFLRATKIDVRRANSYHPGVFSPKYTMEDVKHHVNTLGHKL